MTLDRLDRSDGRAPEPGPERERPSEGNGPDLSLEGIQMASIPGREPRPRNEFEETIERILAIKPIEQTVHGDLEISFGPTKHFALTPQITTTSAQVVISLRHFSGGIKGIKTGIAYLTDQGLHTTSTLHSQDIFCPDERAYATTSLAHLEGLVFGAANIFGESSVRSRVGASIDGVTTRSSNTRHTEDVVRAVEAIRGRIYSPDLGRPAVMSMEPTEVSGASGGSPKGFDFSLSIRNLFTETPLLKGRLDGASPLVELEFVSGSASRTIHTFATTQAALHYIVGVCNGALTADVAQRYNSRAQRFLRILGIGGQ